MVLSHNIYLLVGIFPSVGTVACESNGVDSGFGLFWVGLVGVIKAKSNPVALGRIIRSKKILGGSTREEDVVEYEEAAFIPRIYPRFTLVASKKSCRAKFGVMNSNVREEHKIHFIFVFCFVLAH